jgi:hypothetical protein
LQGFDDSSSLSLQKDTPAFPDFYALLLSEFIFSGSTNYSATAWFSREGFEAIAPGASGAQVRERLGFPLRRAVWSGSEDREHWSYTTGGVAGATKYMEYVVIFDLGSDKVVEKLVREMGFEAGKGVEAIDIANARHFVQEVGVLTVKTLDGEKVRLSSDDVALRVVIHCPIGRRSAVDFIKDVAESVAEEFGALLGETPPLLVVLNESRPEEIERVNAWQAERPNTLVCLSTVPEIRFVDSRVGFLAGGRVLVAPPVFSGPSVAEYREDRQWVARRALDASGTR